VLRNLLIGVSGLGFVALVYFAPVLIDPIRRVAGGSGDPMLVAYIVTWVADHLWTPAAWNPPFLHPATNVLAYSDHLYGLAVLAWPAVAAGVPASAIVNGVAWFAFFLTAVAVFYWLVDSRREMLPSFAAAVTMAYCAWRTQQLSHPHLLFLPWLPLALLCFARAIERRGPTWLVWIGSALLAIQLLCVASLAVLMLPLVALYLTMALVVERRDARVWLVCGVALAAAGIANLPAAAHYWELGASFERSPVEIARHSASLVDWISAPATHWLYADRLAFTQGLERELFPGIGFIVLVAIGTVSAAASGGANRTTVLIGLLVSAVALWASTGPTPDGGSALLHLPYELLTAIVPGARNVRVPARFVILAAIFLAPAIAEGWHRVFDRLVAKFSSRTGTALGVGLLVLVVVEGLPGLTPYGTVTFTTIQTLPATVQGRGLLFLPLGNPGEEIRRMWLARRHGVPVVNGYSGHPSYLWEAIWHLQAGAITHDVRHMLYSRLLDSGVDTIVLEEPDSPLVDRQALEPISDRAFRIPAHLNARDVRTIPLGRGAGLLIPELGWSYPEQGHRESWVWSLDRRAVIAVPMDGGPAQQMSLRVRSLSPGGTATLGLWWNGRLLGSEPLRGEPGVVTFTLPEAATRAGWTRFELDGPVPIRPSASTDPRRLSVCLFEVVVR